MEKGRHLGLSGAQQYHTETRGKQKNTHNPSRDPQAQTAIDRSREGESTRIYLKKTERERHPTVAGQLMGVGHGQRGGHDACRTP